MILLVLPRRCAMVVNLKVYVHLLPDLENLGTKPKIVLALEE